MADKPREQGLLREHGIMGKKISFRIAFVIVSMIICTLFLNLGMLMGMLAFPEQLTRDISEHEKKYEKLREILPVNGIVGYISDDQKDENAGRYYIAQYALAPMIVTRSLDQKIIIGNFRTSSPKSEICEKYGLVTVKDYGNGLTIFSRDIK
jgi:hypothetical protein